MKYQLDLSWLIPTHEFLASSQPINALTRLVAAMLLLVITAFITGVRRTSWPSFTLHVVTALTAIYALVRTIFQLHNSPDGWVVWTLVTVTILAFTTTMHSLRHGMWFTAILSTLGSAAALSAASLIGADIYRNETAVYFLGAGAVDEINWAVAWFVLFIIAPALALSIVSSFVSTMWRALRKPKKKTS